MKKTKSSEEVFLEHICRLINNLLINNPNYKNGHYTNRSIRDLIRDTKERGEYILNEIEISKHLVLEPD